MDLCVCVCVEVLAFFQCYLKNKINTFLLAEPYLKPNL